MNVCDDIDFCVFFLAYDVKTYLLTISVPDLGYWPPVYHHRYLDSDI